MAVVRVRKLQYEVEDEEEVEVEDEDEDEDRNIWFKQGVSAEKETIRENEGRQERRWRKKSLIQ